MNDDKKLDELNQLEDENEIFAHLLPEFQKIAKQELTASVRKSFDTQDIRSTVLRRVVQGVRTGNIKTRDHLVALMRKSTRNVIIEKHKHLSRFIRDHNRALSIESMLGDDFEETSWAPSNLDGNRHRLEAGISNEETGEAFVDEQEAFTELCELIRSHLSTIEWDIIEMRFLSLLSWKEIGLQLGIKEGSARMRAKRALEKIQGCLPDS